MTLPATEFIRRFLLHVLPRGLVRIRHFGFLANRSRARLVVLCREVLKKAPLARSPTLVAPPTSQWQCPRCGAPMVIVEKLTRRDIHLRAIDLNGSPDTS